MPHGSSPRLVLGLPVFNGSNYVEAAIDSVLAQTWTDFKLIIVDNASTDATVELCSRYVAKDPRIELHRNSVNIGAAGNFNRAFELAGTECAYYKWVAHDDVLMPRFLEVVISILDDSPDCVLCHTEVDLIDTSGQRVDAYDSGARRRDSDRPSERFGDMADVVHACFDVFGVYRRDVLAKTPLIAPYIGSDRNLLAEIALHGKINIAGERLFLQRHHPQRSTRVAPIRERGTWFSPHLAGKVVFPHWRQLWEFFRSASRVPIGSIETVRCYFELVLWTKRTRRPLLQDLRAGAAAHLSRIFSRRQSK